MGPDRSLGRKMPTAQGPVPASVFNPPLKGSEKHDLNNPDGSDD